jgi:putative salt-induced outer membrane protein
MRSLFNLTVVSVCALLCLPEAQAFSIKNESEAGIIVTSGNSKSQSFNLKQTSSSEWDKNLLKVSAGYLKTTSGSVTSALQWNLGLRYERSFTESIAGFLAQNADSDLLAGKLQRYNSDLGAKYALSKSEEFSWLIELGYRFMRENLTSGAMNSQNYARLYTEATRSFSKTVSLKYWIEFLPNFSTAEDWQLNTELSLSAALNSVFSLKTAYMLKIDQLPAPGKEKADSTFTTALVAKF